MSREVRMVPKDYQHPKNDAGQYVPLYDGSSYQANADAFMEKANKEGLQEAIEWCGCPDKTDYMPDWSDEEKTHLMMYEDTSEGTPISPACETPEELAHWLADNGASSFGRDTATYEQWLPTCKGAWSPSMVMTDGVIKSGVEFAAEQQADKQL